MYELYFWCDGDQDSEETVIRPMCKECHDNEYGYLGWHYKGKLGPWEYKCNKCEKIIKEEEKQ